MRRKKISQNNNLKNVDIIILCGGKGTRLKNAIGDCPKILAPIGSNVFLDIFLKNIIFYGFRRVILSVGYMKEKIIDYCAKHSSKGLEIVFSKEDYPLGTGGAIKKARNYIKSSHFLVMNGDTLYNNIDFKKFYENHLDKNALLSIILSETNDISDCASIEIDGNGKILAFKEKMPIRKRGLVSAGIYLMNNNIFKYMPDKDSFSIEYDFFPKIILNNDCYGFVHQGEFIDIGAPDRYKMVNQLIKNKF